MVFPARKQPDQASDSSLRWPKPPETGEHMAYMWADYYAVLSDAFEQAVKDTSGPFFTTAASDILIGTSQECIVHMLSEYMKTLESSSGKIPTTKTPESSVYMLLDYIESLGWGKFQVVSFTPSEELIVEVKQSDPATPATPLCHISAGASAAVMDVVFGNGWSANDKMHSFRCTETRCVRRGDALCRFEVKRNYNHGTGQVIPLQQPKS